MNPTSFQAWLTRAIQHTLGRAGAPAPWTLWCDPRLEWRELLQRTSGDSGFALLTCDPRAQAHGELLLRHRFAAAEPAPRVV
jgi:hypothetical protein